MDTAGAKVKSKKGHVEKTNCATNVRVRDSVN